MRDIKFIYMYYIVLMIVTVVRTTETEPNAIIRIGYLLAFFMPIVLKYSELFSVCLVSFMTVGTYSFAYSFFPYQLVIYPIICLFTYIICKGGYGLSLTKNGALLFFSSIYVLLVDVLNGGSPQNIFYSLLLIIFFVLLKGGNATYNLSLMFNGFAATSLALSIVYLSNYEKFVVSYGQGEFERSGWTDPNYLSSIIGMGILTSFVQILRKRNAALPLKLFWIVCAGLSLISQLLMASRGGILATALSIVIVFMFMKIRSIYKVGVFVILCVFIFWLYNSGFFDLLEYRILSDDGSGSGRTVIWVKKLNAFIEEGNPLQWIFGLGYESAFKLAGEGRLLGFHNDFLAILCGYGILGVSVFVYFIMIPLREAASYAKPIVLSLIVYLMVVCATLEPLSAGRLVFFYFLFLIYSCAYTSKRVSHEKSIICNT